MYLLCTHKSARSFLNSMAVGNGRGAMPFLMSFALEPEIVTVAWIDNASVQFLLNIYATKGLIHSKNPIVSSSLRSAALSSAVGLVFGSRAGPTGTPSIAIKAL